MTLQEWRVPKLKEDPGGVRAAKQRKEQPAPIRKEYRNLGEETKYQLARVSGRRCLIVWSSHSEKEASSRTWRGNIHR